jgi:hypothetical protein
VDEVLGVDVLDAADLGGGHDWNFGKKYIKTKRLFFLFFFNMTEPPSIKRRHNCLKCMH